MPTKLRPFFCYYGGKWRASPHYPAPQYKTIIEPFAGAAGYSLRHADKKVVLFDVDPVICQLWEFLINATAEQILSLPDLLDGQTIDDLNVSEPEKHLIGFWLNKGTSRPSKSPSAWMRSGIRPKSYWGPEVRNILASQLSAIRHWEIHQNSFENVPLQSATYFIDPPYIKAGVHYRYHRINYDRLGQWCKSIPGQVIVCENEGASWLPFVPFRDIKSSPSCRGKRVSKEVIYVH